MASRARYPTQFHNSIVVNECRKSKNKVLHTTHDIRASIKTTLFENIPAPLLHTGIGNLVSPRVCSLLKLVLLCSREASELEIVFVDIQKY